MENNTNIKIPKKYHHMVAYIDKETEWPSGRNGYWIYLKDGFYDPETECHDIHVFKASEVVRALRYVRPCDCDTCKKALQEKALKGES